MLVSILERHADEVAFLWLLRDLASTAPHHDARSLAEIDERLDAHLDGLRIADDAGTCAATAALAPDEPGSAFGLMALAAERADAAGIEAALTLAADAKAARALASALAWVPVEKAAPVMDTLLHPNAPPAHVRIGLAAAAARRIDPGAPLAWAVNADDPRVRARALRALGELARSDLLDVARRDLSASDENVRFWAAWSAALLGEPAAIEVLWDIADRGGPWAERAAGLAARRGDVRETRRRIEDLGVSSASARAAIAGAEALGDPALVPWLLEKVQAAPLARAAAEAIAMITGVVIERHLAARAPEGAPAGPTADPNDGDVAMDRDRGLPWPALDALRSWWASREGQYRRGARQLLGSPLTPDRADHLLRTGTQRRRASAAVELALFRPGQPLAEVRKRLRT